jgi:hypothetical protein
MTWLPGWSDLRARVKQLKGQQMLLIAAKGLALIAAANLLVFAYYWGHRWSFDPFTLQNFLLTGALLLAWCLLHLAFILFPDWGWIARLKTPPWSEFESDFKRNRRVINFIAFCYALFYLTEGLKDGYAWARWVNDTVFNFWLFGHRFNAIEVIQIEIFGYAIYLILEVVYNKYCPQILRHRATDGEKATVILVETIEQHGEEILPSNMFDTLRDFYETHRAAFPMDNSETVRHRLQRLQESAEAKHQDPIGATIAAVGDAAALAKLFPQQLAAHIYLLRQLKN